MTNRAHFAVLETPWELDLSLATEESAEPTLLDNPGDLPFEPYEVPGLPAATSTKYYQADVHRAGYDRHELITLYFLPEEKVLTLTQYQPASEGVIFYRIAAGMTRQIKVGDNEGLLIQGRWQLEGHTRKAYWNPTGGATALWMKQGRALTLSSGDLSANEVLDFARGI